MRRRFSHILLALVATGMLCVLAASSWAQDETPAADEARKAPPVPGISVRGDRAWRWRADGMTVLLLTGHAEMVRGSSRLEADHAILWIDEAASARSGRVVLSAYAEGHVSTLEQGTRTLSPRVYFNWAGASFTVDDADGFIEPSERAQFSPFVVRAEGVRKAGVLPPEAAAPLPPKTTPPVGVLAAGQADNGIVPPARFGSIYGQQQEGPDVKYTTEGDYRVTVLTRYPDIVFYEPGSSEGKMEILARNMVIWVNEKKLQSGGRLQEAELEVYAEGDVTIHRGAVTVQCEQLYYDYRNQKALFVGGPDGRAVVRTWNEKYKLPLYYRAKEFRQVSADQWEAKNAVATTCEFARPDWGVYADRMTLTTHRDAVTDASGRTQPGKAYERAEMWDSTVRVQNVPVFWWPHWAMDLKRERTALKRLSIGNSSRFGFTVRSAWDLYNLGIYENDWSDLTLLADYYGERGLGFGLEFDYEREKYFGELLTYGISDSGIDKTGLPPGSDPRARVHWLHRQALNPDWRLDFELSWISDRQFLNEYFEREDKEEKEQESLFYLRYLKENRQLSLTGKWRLNDWQNQLEEMPQARFTWFGEPLFGGRLTWLTDTRLGDLRMRFDDDAQKLGRAPPDYRSWRFWTEHEVQLPLAWGPIKIVPFINGAYAWYENVVEDDSDRVLLTAGVRTSATLWRVYDVYSRLWDINRLRHVVTPTVDVLATFVRTKNPGDVLQFDAVDALDDTKVVRLGLRQRLQTRRRARSIEPAAVGGWYTANWMTLDVELDWYLQPEKHHGGRTLGPMEVEYLWRVTDRIALVSQADVSVDRGVNLDTSDLGVIINRSPKMTFYVGHHYIDVSDSSILVLRGEYKLSERWSFGGLMQHDFGPAQATIYRADFKRRMHRWILDVVYEYNQAENDHSLMFMIIPQGVPEGQFRFF